MKREIDEYNAKLLECQKVKAEHRHPTGLLEPLPIPKWKWEVVSMDFITKFPRTNKKHDSIMVVVDKLTKVLAANNSVKFYHNKKSSPRDKKFL
jgi:hypothetical protein